MSLFLGQRAVPPAISAVSDIAEGVGVAALNGEPALLCTCDSARSDAAPSTGAPGHSSTVAPPTEIVAEVLHVPAGEALPHGKATGIGVLAPAVESEVSLALEEIRMEGYTYPRDVSKVCHILRITEYLKSVTGTVW